MDIVEKIVPWTKGLGSLPVLFSYCQAVGSDHRFAKLDGRTNSICLDSGGEERRDSFRSEAWQSNNPFFAGCLLFTMFLLMHAMLFNG